MAQNPAAPKFTPNEWILDETGDRGQSLAVASNCYQYAIAGSNPDGSNRVFEEAIPNPGETSGTLFSLDTTADPKKFIKALEADGLKWAGKPKDTNPLAAISEVIGYSPTPPAMRGHYLVGVYIENLRTAENPAGTIDYHFVRQDADGGWSDKGGQGREVYVKRLIEPPTNGETPPLPEIYAMDTAGTRSNYRLMGYAYVPEQGIDAGLEAPIKEVIQESIAKTEDGCHANLAGLFNSKDQNEIKNLAITLKKYGTLDGTELPVSSIFENCANKHLDQQKVAIQQSQPNEGRGG
jgi:hypothetical protein